MIFYPQEKKNTLISSSNRTDVYRDSSGQGEGVEIGTRVETVYRTRVRTEV